MLRKTVRKKSKKLNKEVVRETGGYMTKDGKVHLHRVEAVMRAIGRMEDNIFKLRGFKHLSISLLNYTMYQTELH